jgi:nucleotide-binding universal stress UspA family protein
MKILVATDGSEPARWGCEVVGHLPDLAGLTVFLTHVTEPLPEPEVPFPSVFSEDDLLVRERIEKEHEGRAAERLDACIAALPQGCKVVPDPRVGHPAQEVLAAIEAHAPDLVVLGARGLDEAPFGLGGVAQKVTRYAGCPVLVAREGPTRFRRALVALDDGPGAARLVAWLAEARWLAGCAFTLCHVVEDRYLRESRIAASQFAGSEDYLTRLQRALVAEGQRLLDGHVAGLAAAGADVDTLVLEGDPARALAARTETGAFDLVVVGARGRHGLARFLLGSTSQKVLRHAAASVLVVRTDGPD